MLIKKIKSLFFLASSEEMFWVVWVVRVARAICHGPESAYVRKLPEKVIHVLRWGELRRSFQAKGRDSLLSEVEDGSRHVYIAGNGSKLA